MVKIIFSVKGDCDKLRALYTHEYKYNIAAKIDSLDATGVTLCQATDLLETALEYWETSVEQWYNSFFLTLESYELKIDCLYLLKGINSELENILGRMKDSLTSLLLRLILNDFSWIPLSFRCNLCGFAIEY